MIPSEIPQSQVQIVQKPKEEIDFDKRGDSQSSAVIQLFIITLSLLILIYVLVKLAN